MRIRHARREDAKVLDEIALEAKAYWGYSREMISLWASSLATLPESIDLEPTLVAEEETHPIGFAQLNTQGTECELVALWVRPHYMGRGVGRALLSAIVAEARKRGRGSIAIDSDPHAESFYIACGAIQVGALSAPIPGQPSRIRPQLRLRTDAA